MAQVEIVSEDEGAAGWTFGAQVLDEAGGLRRHDVSLSWADYNHWSGSGQDEPARVATAVIHFLLARLPAGELRPAFDASIARRLFPEADRIIPTLIPPAGP
jgi:hypothetical protein